MAPTNRGSSTCHVATGQKSTLVGYALLNPPYALEESIMKEEKLHPVHPGEVLLEEFLKPMGLSQNHLALDIGVPPRRINEIVLETRRITADTVLRLARYFRTTPQFWLGLQTDYDLDMASEALVGRLEREVKKCSMVG